MRRAVRTIGLVAAIVATIPGIAAAQLEDPADDGAASRLHLATEL